MNWLEGLQSKLGGGAEEIPAGWQTPQEIGKEASKGTTWVYKFLARGIGAGLVEVRRFRVASAQGNVRLIPYYRAKPPEDPKEDARRASAKKGPRAGTKK